MSDLHPTLNPHWSDNAKLFIRFSGTGPTGEPEHISYFIRDVWELLDYLADRMEDRSSRRGTQFDVAVVIFSEGLIRSGLASLSNAQKHECFRRLLDAACHSESNHYNLPHDEALVILKAQIDLYLYELLAEKNKDDNEPHENAPVMPSTPAWLPGLEAKEKKEKADFWRALKEAADSVVSKVVEDEKNTEVKISWTGAEKLSEDFEKHIEAAKEIAQFNSERKAAQTEVEQNYEAFKEIDAYFSQTNRKGQFALMASQDLVGIFETFPDAHTHGVADYGLGKFSIQEIGAEPTFISANWPVK